eukprot:gene8335-9189_t
MADELQTHLKELSDEVDKIVAQGGSSSTVSKGGESNNTGTNAEETDGVTVQDSPSTGSTIESVDVKNLNDVQLIQFLQQKAFEKQLARYERAQLRGKDIPKEHKFWNTQPMLALNEEVSDVNGPINDTMTVDQVRAEPLNMPAGFEWCDLDVNDPEQAQELYTLLNLNYVEDDDCMFRFDYSIPFLQWALTPPGYLTNWHVGVRNAKTKALMGCITAVPVHVRVHDKTVPMAEINFLCVHKKLRTKRLAPVLIKEITRRVNQRDIWQAVYTAGVVLPKPVARCRYNHRSLNPKKLIEVRFSSLPPRTTLADHLKQLKLPKKPVNRLQPMASEDVPGVHALLTDYLAKKTKLTQVFTEDEVRHVFLPRHEVVSSFVLKNESGQVTDFCSFYHLPSTVIGNPLHDKLHAVYSYYNVATTISLEDLMRDLLVLARNEGADVFNALDLMENSKVFNSLQFGAGDGWLQYYVYNWKCPTMQSSDVGIVLL